MIKRKNLKHELITQMGHGNGAENAKKQWPISEIKAALTVIGSTLFLTFGLYYIGYYDVLNLEEEKENLILNWMVGFTYLLMGIVCSAALFGLYCLYKHLRDEVF